MESCFRRALSIFESHEDSDKVKLADTLESLADLYRLHGKYDQAEPLFSKAIAVREATLGPDHPTIGAMLQIWRSCIMPKVDTTKPSHLCARARI
ncbi:MAG: tetratricopeptide repeat protein [Candidatus Melainabacteria bacterium]|nr:MAG: tetratricopeptide repeat protein [Candidatus Melainabacteria bacterium]